MSWRIEINVSATAALDLFCDGCKSTLKVRSKLKGNEVYDAVRMVKRDAKYTAFDKGWVMKHEAPKGIKHYCPVCMEKPELAAWHMQKLLTKK
jgi:hypothetical protein